MAKLALVFVVAMLARNTRGSNYTHGAYSSVLDQALPRDIFQKPTINRLLLSSLVIGDNNPEAAPHSSSDSILTLEDGTPEDTTDAFGIFNSPVSQDTDPTSSSTSSFAGSSDDSSGGDMFGSDWSSDADPMQQLYSSMTWSTYYPGSTGTEDDTGTPNTGDSSSASTVQESGQLQTAEPQPTFESTMAGMQVPVGDKGYTPFIALPSQDTADPSSTFNAAQGMAQAQSIGADSTDFASQDHTTNRTYTGMMLNTTQSNHSSIGAAGQTDVDFITQQQSQHASADPDRSKLYGAASSSGAENAHQGPGLITGVRVSLAGAALAALGIIIW